MIDTLITLTRRFLSFSSTKAKEDNEFVGKYKTVLEHCIHTRCMECNLFDQCTKENDDLHDDEWEEWINNTFDMITRNNMLTKAE